MKLLPGKVEVVLEGETGVVFVTVAEAQAAMTLAYLDALECGKIKSFSIGTQGQNVRFSMDSQIVCTTSGFERTISLLLTAMQYEQLRCCCLDSILNQYRMPHEDLECGKFDLTFGIDDAH